MRKSTGLKKKRRKTGLIHSKPHKGPTSTGLACVMHVRGFDAGVQRGARGRRSRGWHWEGVCQDLAVVQVLLLGVRVHREACRLSGAGGGTRSWEEKREKKDSNMHKNMTCLSRCVCAVDVWAGSLQGWHEARWMQQDLAERDVENRAVSRD